MNDRREIWFAAKRYGWGWGLPTRWQGWVVVAVFVAAMALGGFLFPPRHHGVGFGVYVLCVSSLFTTVVAWKGERPRWRWGGE